MVFFGLISVVLASAMPRSGGDYVWTSRIMHPYLAYIEGFAFVIAAMGFAGFNAWAIMVGGGGNMLTGIASGSPQMWINAWNWFTVPTNQYILGAVVFLAMGIVCVVSMRGVHRIVTAAAAISLVSMVVIFFSFFGVDSNSFNSNFAHMVGNQTSQVVATATNSGMSLSSSFSLATFGALFSFALFSFLGFNLSSYMAGELKGNISRNTLIAVLAGLVAILFTLTIYYLPMYNVGGTYAAYGWGFLYWNAPSIAPFSSAPLPTVLAAIAHPSIWPLYLILGLAVFILFNFLIVVGYIVLSSRVVFAMSMDRMAPKWLGEVSSRTASPVRLMLLMTLGGFLFFLATVTTSSPINTLYFTSLAWLPSWLFPGLNALILPYRRKDLFEAVPSPWSKKVVGVPVAAILGLIWTVFIVVVYATTVLPPIYQTLTAAGTSVVSTAISSGVVDALIVLVIGTVLYFITTWWNKRKLGIDPRMIFKEIPPE